MSLPTFKLKPVLLNLPLIGARPQPLLIRINLGIQNRTTIDKNGTGASTTRTLNELPSGKNAATPSNPEGIQACSTANKEANTELGIH